MAALIAATPCSVQRRAATAWCGWGYPVLWALVALHGATRGGARYALDRAIGREV